MYKAGRSDSTQSKQIASLVEFLKIYKKREGQLLKTALGKLETMAKLILYGTEPAPC